MWDIIGSIVTGGATGLLGAGISGITEFLKQKQKNAHDLAMSIEDRESLKLEIDGREKVARIEGETATSVADAAAFAQSMKADKATYAEGSSSGWLVAVDFFRGITRPGMTWYFAFFVTGIYFTTDLPEVKDKIVVTVLYVTTTMILWWFGTRNKKPA